VCVCVRACVCVCMRSCACVHLYAPEAQECSVTVTTVVTTVAVRSSVELWKVAVADPAVGQALRVRR
jgi:hypothetical protein